MAKSTKKNNKIKMDTFNKSVRRGKKSNRVSSKKKRSSKRGKTKQRGRGVSDNDNEPLYARPDVEPLNNKRINELVELLIEKYSKKSGFSNLFGKKEKKKHNGEVTFFNASSNKKGRANQALPPIPNAVSQGPYLHPPSYHYSNSNNSESSGYSGEYAFPDDTNKNSVISNSDMESLGSVTQDNTSGSVKDNTYDINPGSIHLFPVREAKQKMMSVEYLALPLGIMRSNFFINFQIENIIYIYICLILGKNKKKEYIEDQVEK